MTDVRLQRMELEAVDEPAAILQAGTFAYANHAFLELVGVADLDELLAIPLLDLVSRSHHEALKKHLAKAERLRADSGEKCVESFEMVSQRSEHLEVSMTAVPVEFDGERCVQITLRPQAPRTVRAFLKGRPWAYYFSVAFLVLFATLPPLLLPKLNINNAPRVYFPAHEPAVIVDNALRETFPSDQVVVMMFEGIALYSDEFLEAFDGLAQKLESNPHVRKVFTVTTQDHISASEDGFAVGPLMDIETLDDSHPRDRPGIVMADRFAQGMLVSQDGKALAMVVIPDLVENSLQRLELMKEINAAVADAGLDGYVTAVAGEVPADIAQLQAMLHNNMIFIPATTIIGLSMIWWLFRRPLAVVVAGISVGVVTSTTIALYVVFGRPFTMIASIIPPLLSALTMASLVHIFNAINYSAQRGLTGVARVKFALKEVRTPALFCELTTVIGLASLATTPIAPLAEFGLISAAGVMLIYFVVMVLMPQILIRWDRAHWPVQRDGLEWMDLLVRKCAAIGIRHPLHVLGVAGLLFAVGLPQIWNVHVETSIQEYFAADHPYRQSTDRIDERMVGTTPLDVVFETTEPGGLLDPAKLNEIQAFEEWVEARPEVDKAISPVDFIKEMNWSFHDEDPAFRVLPEDKELIAQYLLIYDGDELGDFLDDDRRVARVSLNLNLHNASDITALMEDIRAYLGSHVNTEMQWDIAGLGRLFADQERLLVGGQVYSLLGSVFTIFLLMAFLWRSLWQSVVTMIPNLTPIIMIFMFMGVAGIWLDMATVMVASVTAGIAVDDTIHLYHGFMERLRSGSTPARAIMRVYSQTGRAVIITTVILSSQFFILMISDFRPFRNFGLLTGVGLVSALVFELFVTPALLMVVYGRKKKPAPGAPLPAAS